MHVRATLRVSHDQLRSINILLREHYSPRGCLVSVSLHGPVSSVYLLIKASFGRWPRFLAPALHSYSTGPSFLSLFLSFFLSFFLSLFICLTYLVFSSRTVRFSSFSYGNIIASLGCSKKTKQARISFTPERGHIIQASRLRARRVSA